MLSCGHHHWRVYQAAAITRIAHTRACTCTSVKAPFSNMHSGMACVMIFGSYMSEDGVLLMPDDVPTRALYITALINMCMWGLLIPFLFKWVALPAWWFVPLNRNAYLCDLSYWHLQCSITLVVFQSLRGSENIYGQTFLPSNVFPSSYRFRLNYRTAVIGFLFYAGFQAMFVTLLLLQPWNV